MLAGAAAMLAACSSEDPQVGGSNVAEDDGMYLAINIVGAQTRAEGDAEAEPVKEEDKITQLQIFILDDQENLYFSKEVSGDDIKNGIAKFSVTQATFADMKAKVEREAVMKVIVYANGVSVNSSEDIMHGSTSSITWGIENTASEGYNEDGFIMSNASETAGTLEKAPDGAGTAKNPWVIKSDIELSRLASRFDYATTNKDQYTALHENGVKLAVAGFDVETFATTTYRISQFTADGLPNFESGKHCHFAPAGELKYRVTEQVTNGEVKNYNAYKYPLVKGKQLYRRPNTISTKYTFKNNKEDYKVIPFAVVKAEFTSTDFAGAGFASKSMAAGKNVYAVDGVFVGGYEDFMELRKAGKKFAVNYGDETQFTSSEKENIQAIVDNYNRLLEMSLPSDYDSSKGDAENAEWFKKGLGKADEYKAQGGKYYTYYASFILHDKDNADKCWKYGVSRNTAYALSVNSFKYLGNSGGGKPGDGPTPAEMSDMAIQLTVKILDWTLNFNNNWDL